MWGLLILKAVNRDTKITINFSRNSGYGVTTMQHTSGSGCFSHIKQVTLHTSGNSYKQFFLHAMTQFKQPVSNCKILT
jgi:hypothetical protein